MKSTIPLSILDVALIETGTTAAQSLEHTVTLARRAEELGYARLWVAEHHTPGAASASPAVVIGQVAARTTSLRVGAGGVLLPNHSPLVVAEEFGTLGAFFPNRIDLGIGRGAGTQDDAIARELRRGAPEQTADEHRQQFETLLGSFENTDPQAVPVTARPSTAPQVWALASSVVSAQAAAELGLPLAFAHHIRPMNTVESIARYREAFRPSARLAEPHVMVSVTAIVANSDDRANELALAFEIYLATQLLSGNATTVPTPAEALAYSFSEQEQEFLGGRRQTQIQGSPTTAARQLHELIAATSADELMVLTPVYGIEDRLRSFELLATLGAS